MNACIFDLDGVIVDTARYHFQAWKKLADELGVNLTVEDNERLKGVGRIESLDIILEMGKLKRSEDEKIALARKKNSWFVEYINAMHEDEIFDGIKNLFAQLRLNNKKVGLASSSKNAKTVLDKLKIRTEFDTIVDGNMITNSKPDPEIFLLAASMLQTDPQDCVVVEDAAAGVEAAKRAGMKCIGIGSPAQLLQADRVLSGVDELTFDILSKL